MLAWFFALALVLGIGQSIANASDRAKERKRIEQNRLLYLFRYEKDQLEHQLFPQAAAEAQKRGCAALEEFSAAYRIQSYSYYSEYWSAVSEAAKNLFPPSLGTYVHERIEAEWAAKGQSLPDMFEVTPRARNGGIWTIYDECKWPNPKSVPQYAIDDWRRYYGEHYHNKLYPPYGVDLYNANPNDPDPNKRRAIQLYHEERHERYCTLRGQVLSELQQILYQRQLFDYEYKQELAKEDPKAAAQLPEAPKPAVQIIERPYARGRAYRSDRY